VVPIHADVMDREIERVTLPLHAKLRGAAIFAAMALRAVDAREVRGLVEVDATFVPDPANRSVYDRPLRRIPPALQSDAPDLRPPQRSARPR